MDTGAGPLDQLVMSEAAFRAFYRAHLPAVYGYLLRLCAGNVAQAEDLTQEVWYALVEELRRGHAERADVRWLITVARSRFVDHARRERRSRAKLMLIWAERNDDVEPNSSDVLDCLADLQPIHRAVLVMRHVDGLSVPEIASAIDREIAATNSLLGRARVELRRACRGAAHV